MSGHMEDDLERKLREQRSDASDEFVRDLAASVRSRRFPSARPRVTLAFALSIALLVSLVAFGGVGAASSALHSSATAVRTAVGHEKPKSKSYKQHPESPAKHQYHGKVTICYPRTRIVTTHTTVTKYRWVWKTVTIKGKKIRVLVKKPYQVKVRVRTKVTTYVTKTVSQQRVPGLVAGGAVYPIPAGGCSSLGGSSPTSD